MRAALVLAMLQAGCMATIQLTVGPTVDERGGVGGVVRLRGSAGVPIASAVVTGEAAGFQTQPHGLFGLGVGAVAHFVPSKVTVAVGGRVLIATSPPGSVVGAAGAWLSVIPILRERAD